MKINCTLIPSNLKILSWYNVMVLSLIVAFFFFASACKKESTNNGIPSGPSGNGFSDCQLTKFCDDSVTYYPDSTIKSIGSITYKYKGDSLLINTGHNPCLNLLLDAGKRPVASIYVSNMDSFLINYSYTTEGYLSKLEMIKLLDGMGIDTVEINNEYSNGNKVKRTASSKGEVISIATFKYDLNKLDSRKDFSERMYFNLVDPLNLIMMAGKANKNLVLEETYTVVGGPILVKSCSYEFDNYGKVTRNIISENGHVYAELFYSYLCN